ncbi:MAG: hypothetical protein GYA59_10015 [Chloroflexi bacterium]|nr:hypothetical protein [Chloroflexota bacterium]
MNSLVECYSGCEYAERPTALIWQGERLEIAEILKQWRQPGERCFRVRTQDDRLFELAYDESLDQWRINAT